MKNKTEELLEEMTKVRPEQLTPEAHKLWVTICNVLDDNDDLVKYKKKCAEMLAFIEGNQKYINQTLYIKLISILK